MSFKRKLQFISAAVSIAGALVLEIATPQRANAGTCPGVFCVDSATCLTPMLAASYCRAHTPTGCSYQSETCAGVTSHCGSQYTLICTYID